MVLALLAHGVVLASSAVENGSFEDGFEGWTAAPNIVIDTKNSHSGGKSACIVVQDAKRDEIYLTRRIPVLGGARYEASCYLRTENVQPAECRDTPVGAGMIIEWADENGAYLGWGSSTYNNFGTRDWFKIESKMLRTPEKARYALVTLALRGTGKAWFDDFSLTQMDVSVAKALPENGSTFSNNCPEFVWQTSPGITNYVVRLSRDAAFAPGTVRDIAVGGAIRLQLETPLEPGVWHWKVSATGMDDREPWTFTQTAPRDCDCLPPLVRETAVRVYDAGSAFAVSVKDGGGRRPVLTFAGLQGEFVRAIGDGLLEYSFRPPAAGWAAGLTDGEITAVDEAGNRKASRFWLLNAPKPANAVKVGAGGRYEQNGKPIFPLGIYQVDPKYMGEVKEAGFDIVHLYRWEEQAVDDAECRTYLDACSGSGLRAFVGFDRGKNSGRGIVNGNFEHVARRVAALADHPGLFCWYLYDEPEILGQFVSPDLLASFANLIRRLDPHHPVVMSTWGNANYRASWDSHWTQGYGNPAEELDQLHKQVARLGDSPISLIVYANDNKLALARRLGQPTDPNDFALDYDHMRACAFLGVVKNCNGLWWWWFAKDGSYYYSAAQSPKAWADLTKVVQELRTLRPLFNADGEVKSGEAVAGQDTVAWWSKTTRCGRMTIAVNTADHPVTVKLSAPDFGFAPVDFKSHEVKIVKKKGVRK